MQRNNFISVHNQSEAELLCSKGCADEAEALKIISDEKVLAKLGSYKESERLWDKELGKYSDPVNPLHSGTYIFRLCAAHSSVRKPEVLKLLSAEQQQLIKDAEKQPTYRPWGSCHE